MRSPARLLLLALVALATGLVAAGNAFAVIGSGNLVLPPFTKAQSGAGNAVTATFNWTPATFLDNPLNQNHQDIVATSTDGGAVGSADLGATVATVPLLLSNGRAYTVDVSACQATGLCTTLSPTAFLDMSATTRIDATPPTGTVQINGGAVFTNNPVVTLNLTATDPLIDGIAGSSSGVTQEAVDRDGDGTYPCVQFVPIGQLIDRSGCAGNFAPTVQTTLTDGDGLKAVSVEFGDGARTPGTCTGAFCHILLLGSPILGNVSVAATDTIGLDTVKPVAIAVQSAFSVTRGTSVTFNSSTSTDSGTGASGIDPTLTTWNFSDGSAVATGAKVTHTYTKDGTFVGELRVRDRAGNVSDVRNFAVTVTAAPGDTTAGSGSVGGVSGTAGFTVSSFRVKARYAKSVLSGSVRLTGAATQAGALRAEIRSLRGNKRLKGISLKALAAGPFTRTITLPATLLPGSYRINLVGPGGTLSTTLTLTPPREGVIRSGRIVGSRAVFSLAARPVKALRTKLTVRWTQGTRSLGVVTVGSATTIRALLPAGASLGSGKLTATLRAGTKAIGSATRRIR